MNSLDQIVNLKVRITNLLDESISGTIYAFSTKQKVLALKVTHQPTGKSPSPQDDSFRIINTAFIKSINVLPPFPKKNSRPSEFPSNVPKIDVKQLEHTLNKMLESANKIPEVQASQRANSPATGKFPNTSHKKADTGTLASKVFERLSSKLGKENVQWQGNDSILLFKEVSVSKPYALNKISNSKRTQSSKYLEKARVALREAWLEDDNSKRGG
ncbi:hypothetical protein JCM33374_g5845 [Metschnikowia sp. JCM 33374]|nr:hypothetical protein JCM33374_g5845 [Metschnikowia sp. JCM 33374]